MPQLIGKMTQIRSMMPPMIDQIRSLMPQLIDQIRSMMPQMIDQIRSMEFSQCTKHETLAFYKLQA